MVEHYTIRNKHEAATVIKQAAADLTSIQLNHIKGYQVEIISPFLSTDENNYNPIDVKRWRKKLTVIANKILRSKNIWN